MKLRKTLTVGAAVLAAGVLGSTSAGQAGAQAGGPIASIWVNGVGTPGDVPIDGTVESGTTSIAGGTYGCTGGIVDGIVKRGPGPLPIGEHPMEFSTLSIVCSTPLGVDATISISCGANADYYDTDVNTGTVDTGTASVTGEVPILPGCGTVTAGPCTADVQGTVAAFFDEAVTPVIGVNHQRLILDGPDLTLSNQSIACLGQLDGALALNDITFIVKVSSGTTTGIDFRP